VSAGAPGRFITLEGGEGAGKSTQIARLADWLRSRGRDVVSTREPGGSPGAELIRKLLVEGPAERWDGTTEALLHYAARRDHLRATVWPALERVQSPARRTVDQVIVSRVPDRLQTFEETFLQLRMRVVRVLGRIVRREERRRPAHARESAVEIGHGVWGVGEGIDRGVPVAIAERVETGLGPALGQLVIEDRETGASSGETVEASKRALERTEAIVHAELKRGLGGLATIGSTAPFVGLFGTVMGILNAFKGISEQKATGLAAVAGGIAEALVTTALGLLVAIPAVMMFNYLTGRVEAFDVEMDNSSSELIDYFLKRRGMRRA